MHFMVLFSLVLEGFDKLRVQSLLLFTIKTKNELGPRIGLLFV